MFIENQVFADCGADHGAGKGVADAPAKKARVNSLITAVPDDGNIEGLVITSCGQCKLGYKGKPGCSLTIKIDEVIYLVKGTGLHEHGDAHGSEGFCSAIGLPRQKGKLK